MPREAGEPTADGTLEHSLREQERGPGRGVRSLNFPDPSTVQTLNLTFCRAPRVVGQPARLRVSNLDMRAKRVFETGTGVFFGARWTNAGCLGTPRRMGGPLGTLRGR